MKTKVLILVVGVMVAALVVVGVIILKGDIGSSQPKPSADKLVGVNPHRLGTAGAKVTLVEFGDYQCQSCFLVYPAVKQIVKDYGDRIIFVFRSYPLSQHPNAAAAAQVAEEAGVQGKFWEMHDRLYETQKDWTGQSGDALLRQYLSYANDLGLDANKVKAAVEHQTYKQRIAQDQADGTALSITGTPAFFVNGKLLPGVPDYPVLRDAIEAALKG